MTRSSTESAQTGIGMHGRIACGQWVDFLKKSWVRERYGERKNGGPHDHNGKRNNEHQGQRDGK